MEQMTAKRRSGSGSHRALLLRRRSSRRRRRRRRRWWWRYAMRLRKRITESTKKRVRDRPEENVSNNVAIKRYSISTSNCTKTVLRRRRVTAPVVHLESLPACYQPPSSPTFCSRTLPITLFRRCLHLARGRRPQSVRRR